MSLEIRGVIVLFDIEYYTLPDGEKPVEQFVDGLEPKMQAKAFRSMEILEEFGTKLREPHSKPVGDGLFELRIQFSNDITRIFYFFFANNKIVLTNGFVKKTRKTPAAELERARGYQADYMRRASV